MQPFISKISNGKAIGLTNMLDEDSMSPKPTPHTIQTTNEEFLNQHQTPVPNDTVPITCKHCRREFNYVLPTGYCEGCYRYIISIGNHE